MAGTHPYTTSQAGLTQTLTQFRKAFPSAVDASTLKKLGFAPNNESYVLNVLRFLGLLSEDGKKTEEAVHIFTLHDDKEFKDAFAARVMTSYVELFNLHGDATWDLDLDSLIGFFRANDTTSAIVGKKQAQTFQLLAGFAGHGEVPEARPPGGKTKEPTARKTARKSTAAEKKAPLAESTTITPPASQVGLTVRIEVNLPADGNQATYDRIFRSIRENLLDG